MYVAMLRVRRFEEQARELYQASRVALSARASSAALRSSAEF
jgi:hypothetical protein